MHLFRVSRTPNTVVIARTCALFDRRLDKQDKKDFCDAAIKCADSHMRQFAVLIANGEPHRILIERISISHCVRSQAADQKG